MNKLKYIAVIAILGSFGTDYSFAQLKEEKLILDRKREPEVKRIEKKKTSVEIEKNYPPEEKSKEVITYDITDVPAVSDFKTTQIEGEDISPKFNSDFQRNYFQLGFGNYGKFLVDANISSALKENLDVGVDVHYLSTNGLKNVYDWSSKQSQLSGGLYLNSYTDLGKFNLDVNFGMDRYNYYGIYALKPNNNNVDLEQRVNRFQLKGFYDHYNNDILNNVTVKSSLLTDHFDTKETIGNILVNLSKHDLGINESLKLNSDLGVELDVVDTKFGLLDKNQNNFFNFNVEPKITFFKGESYLTLGSNFSFFSQKNQNLLTDQVKNSKIYWFPKAELQVAALDQFKFYAGVEGGLKLNSYNSLLEENPYLLSDLYLKPTETKYRFYLGIKGDIDETFKYDISAGYGKQNNILLFKSNSLINNLVLDERNAYDFVNTFTGIYDDGTLSEVKASLQYFPLENLVVDGELNFMKYKLENNKNAYYKPLVQASFGAKYTMLEKKLNLGFKAILVTDRTGNDFELIEDQTITPYNYTINENNDHKVGGYADINLSAEYKIHKNFSIFVNGNNLLNTKYQTFNGYKVLGAQILGGLKISF